MRNSYYEIAIDDLHYAEDSFPLGYYNQVSAQFMQASEKALKSVLELVDTGIESLLKTHSLKSIYYRIHKIQDSFVLNDKDLSYLTDFYFDTRYPGDNYWDVTEEQCLECAKITYDVLDCVNRFRMKEQLPVYDTPRKVTQDYTPVGPKVDEIPDEGDMEC